MKAKSKARGKLLSVQEDPGLLSPSRTQSIAPLHDFRERVGFEKLLGVFGRRWKDTLRRDIVRRAWIWLDRTTVAAAAATATFATTSALLSQSPPIGGSGSAFRCLSTCLGRDSNYALGREGFFTDLSASH